MRNFATSAGIIAVILAWSFCVPASAKSADEVWWEDTPAQSDVSTVHVVTPPNINRDDTHIYQEWYDAQVRECNDADSVTGERFGDLIQLVTDVAPDMLTIADRTGIHHHILITGRTRVAFPDAMRNGVVQHNDLQVRKGAHITDFVRPGDLVVVQGYLRSAGNLVASDVRVVRRAWGWDENADADQPAGFTGYRAWGQVAVVEMNGGGIEVNSNMGHQTIALANGGVILTNGRIVSLQYLRPGDRIVFYYNNDMNGKLQAYRIVLLQPSDSFPTGGVYWADPQGATVSTVVQDDSPVCDGEVVLITPGTFFYTVVVRGHDGHEMTMHVARPLAITAHGVHRFTLDNVKPGQHFHASYKAFGGRNFVHKVDIR